MKIDYLTHQVPYPPDKGEKIRAYHFLAYLASRHPVRLFTLAESERDRDYASSLEPICASVDVVMRSRLAGRVSALAALPSNVPLSVAAYGAPGLRRAAARRLSEGAADVVVAYTCPMSAYLGAWGATPRLLDFVDVDSEKWRAYSESLSWPQSFIYGLEWKRLRRFEGEMARRVEASLFVSEAEASILRPDAPGRTLSVIPNGVDVEYFRGEPERETPGREIVFTGVMDYHPNVDAVVYFTREILPLVAHRLPDVTFSIVGRRPAPSIASLARLPNVQVTGEVPDVRPYLRRARVAIAPFRIARGIQNKILEALAMGVPVVAAPPALQGIASTGETGIAAGADAPSFADALVLLLTDDVAWRRHSEAARRYVERHHRWSESGARLEELLLGITEAARAGRGRASAGRAS